MAKCAHACVTKCKKHIDSRSTLHSGAYRCLKVCHKVTRVCKNPRLWSHQPLNTANDHGYLSIAACWLREMHRWVGRYTLLGVAPGLTTDWNRVQILFHSEQLMDLEPRRWLALLNYICKYLDSIHFHPPPPIQCLSWKNLQEIVAHGGGGAWWNGVSVKHTLNYIWLEGNGCWTLKLLIAATIWWLLEVQVCRDH